MFIYVNILLCDLVTYLSYSTNVLLHENYNGHRFFLHSSSLRYKSAVSVRDFLAVILFCDGYIHRTFVQT